MSINGKAIYISFAIMVHNAVTITIEEWGPYLLQN